MSGERRADRDRGGFFVANFSDHQHLRILPQQMSRGFREVEPARLV